MTPPRQPVWFAEDRPRKPRLSRERIVRAAVDLLDADGVSGFSMRRLAARLGVGVMSTYEYIGSIEDLYDLAVDEVLAEIELTPTTTGADDWRQVLTRQLQQSRDAMKRHPWVASLMATRPLLGPNFLAGAERFYATLAAAGLRPPHLNAAVGTLTYYVQGYVAAENTWHNRIRDPAQETELRRQAQQFIDRHAQRYPALTHYAQLGDDDFDAQFQLGLDTIFDGIQAQLTATSPRRRRRARNRLNPTPETT